MPPARPSSLACPVAALPAGTQYWIFTGRLDRWHDAAARSYTSHVTATDGTLSATQTTSFDVDAFSIKPSDTHSRARPVDHRDGRLGRVAGGGPTLCIYQPGVAAWSRQA